MWAPLRRPQGEKNNATDVSPIATPITARRANRERIAAVTGDAGWPSNVPKQHADTMNRPSSVPSMAHSRQPTAPDRATIAGAAGVVVVITVIAVSSLTRTSDAAKPG